MHLCVCCQLVYVSVLLCTCIWMVGTCITTYTCNLCDNSGLNYHCGFLEMKYFSFRTVLHVQPLLGDIKLL